MRAATVLLGLTVVAGCNDASSTGEENAFTAIIRALSPLADGDFEPFFVDIRWLGTASPVTLGTSQVPAGITVTFDSNGVRGAVATGRISVGSSVPAATYHFFITGTASGAPDVSAEATLVVGAAADYTMSVSPTSLNVNAGSSGSTAVTLSRNSGFTGDVFLSAIVPTGITVTFNPSDVTGTTSTATIAVAAGTAAGTYRVTIHGIESGTADRTADVTVVVR